jgi:hypothetical protein
MINVANNKDVPALKQETRLEHTAIMVVVDVGHKTEGRKIVMHICRRKRSGHIPLRCFMHPTFVVPADWLAYFQREKKI